MTPADPPQLDTRSRPSVMDEWYRFLTYYRFFTESSTKNNWKQIFVRTLLQIHFTLSGSWMIILLEIHKIAKHAIGYCDRWRINDHRWLLKLDINFIISIQDKNSLKLKCPFNIFLLVSKNTRVRVLLKATKISNFISIQPWITSNKEQKPQIRQNTKLTIP